MTSLPNDLESTPDSIEAELERVTEQEVSAVAAPESSPPVDVDLVPRAAHTRKRADGTTYTVRATMMKPRRSPTRPPLPRLQSLPPLDPIINEAVAAVPVLEKPPSQVEAPTDKPSTPWGLIAAGALLLAGVVYLVLAGRRAPALVAPTVVPAELGQRRAQRHDGVAEGRSDDAGGSRGDQRRVIE